MLTSLMSTILSQIIFCAYSLAYLYDLPDKTEIGFSNKEDLVYLIWTTLAVTFILFLLDAYLLGFHIYLICLNTTTYKHIRKQTKKRKSRIIREVVPKPGVPSPNKRGMNRDSEEQPGNANSFNSQSGNNWSKVSNEVEVKKKYKP